MLSRNSEEIPVNIVGGSTFGRYPKISLEKTYNMFISDEWLVNYAGFQKVIELFSAGEGRGCFHSIRGNFVLVVAGSSVYRIGSNLSSFPVGTIDTTSREVFMDENLNNQICIVDGQNAYIYNYGDGFSGSLTKQTLVFAGNTIRPNYVCYHNTFFLIASSAFSVNPQFWYAFQRATDTTISLNTQLSLQTKPDSAIAVKRLPGRGNNVIVFGSSVAEIWTQVGGVENYRRVQSFNIDSGSVSVATIAASEEVICWLAQNENNAPFIMVSDGSSAKRMSTDGIDHLLETIQYPNQSTAFFFRQDGHLFYQLTFYHPKDNVSLVHDFNTGKFFHVSDQSLNFHPARQVVYFDERTFFISLNDASFYQMSSEFLTYNYNLDEHVVGDEIPRIRICGTYRTPGSNRFRVNEFTFTVEQGVNQFYLPQQGENETGFVVTQEEEDLIILQGGGGFVITQEEFYSPNRMIDRAPRIDMSFSKNGNQSFSNIVSKQMNPYGHYRNRVRFQRMGQANEFTVQLRFWGFQRFVVNNGLLGIS